MNFYNYNFNIDKIVLACRVPAGTGEAVHKNRPSHGLAFNVGGEKKYIFDKKKVFTVKENDIIFLPEKSDYVVNDVTSGDCYAINFKISEDVSFEPFVLHIKNREKILNIFTAAEKSFRTKKNAYEIKCKAELYELIYCIVNEYNTGYFSSREMKLLLPSVDYIHNFYSEKNIEIDFLAELCGIKEAYFRRIFTKCYGVSPVKYINALKLARAKELLVQSEYSVENTAYLSGFNNVYYFCRFFKKETGMNPSEYKKKTTF